jgi:hypothetical protein
MGILLKCDSNNTGTSARSEVGRIVLAGVEEDGDDSD